MTVPPSGNTTAQQTSTMQSGAAAMADAASQMNTIQNQFVNTVDSLTGQWSGAAATQFAKACEQWNTDYQAIISGLNRIYDQLTNTNKQFTGAEDFNAQLAALATGSGSTTSDNIHNTLTQ